MLRHINYIEIMILALHRYSGRPILVRHLETLRDEKFPVFSGIPVFILSQGPFL